jgi:adenine phosphoribosyltransferase
MGDKRFRVEINFVGGHADVWRLFDDGLVLREIAEALVAPFRGEITKVAGVESRGFILGTAAALALSVGFVPIRKEWGLFPGPKATAEAGVDYRGNRHTLRLQRAALGQGDRVLLVDDWIETGSQARAAKTLIEDCGAQLAGITTVVTQASPDVLAELGNAHALVTFDELSDVLPG